MKKVLLLGGSGFIGRNLKEYLDQKKDLYSVETPKSSQLNLINEDEVRGYLESNYYDVVIHAAVYNPRIGTDKERNKEIDFNLRMFLNFERYSDKFGKMYYFGSGAEFDKSGDISDVKADGIINRIPETDYGLYKYVINKCIKASRNIYNLRVFGLFGKYENWKTTFISGGCCKAIKNLPITIRQNVFFDYLYIDDFCKIMEWFINNEPEYHEYNVTSGKRVDLITIAKIIMKISGKTLPLYVCREGLAKEYTSDNSRLIKEINGTVLTPIEESIDSLFHWYLENEKMIDIYDLLYP